MSQIPQTKLTLDADQISAAYQRVRPEIEHDPLFMNDAADFGVSLAGLDEKMKNPLSSADNLWDWLDGADQYRYAGLKVLFAAFGRMHSKVTIDGDATMEEVSQIIASDVEVTGNLILDEKAMLMVLGTLSVGGNIVADTWDYTLVSANDIHCNHGLTGGEFIALEKIVCRGTLYLHGNDHSCRAPAVAAGVLVDFERANAFSTVTARTHVKDWDFDAAAKALGLSVSEDEDLHEIFRQSIVGS